MTRLYAPSSDEFNRVLSVACFGGGGGRRDHELSGPRAVGAASHRGREPSEPRAVGAASRRSLRTVGNAQMVRAPRTNVRRLFSLPATPLAAYRVECDSTDPILPLSSPAVLHLSMHAKRGRPGGTALVQSRPVASRDQLGARKSDRATGAGRRARPGALTGLSLRAGGAAWSPPVAAPPAAAPVGPSYTNQGVGSAPSRANSQETDVNQHLEVDDQSMIARGSFAPGARAAGRVGGNGDVKLAVLVQAVPAHLRTCEAL
jgi:hypothetical protein